MCSVQEEGTVTLDIQPKISGRTCMKCGEEAVLVIRGSDPMCKPCFVGYCTHKFRAAFGKSRIVRDGEKALVAFSAGQGSSAMLHLIQQGKSPRANRKLRFQPSLVYIDDGAVLSLSSEKREENTLKVVDLMVKSDLPWCVYKLEQVLDPSFADKSDKVTDSDTASDVSSAIATMSDLETQMKALKISDHLTDKFTQLLTNCGSITAKESLISTLRNQLLVTVARHRGFHKVLLGDSCTRLAVHMLSDIAQGRGAHVALQMSFADCRYGDVIILRPMREFVAKEVAMYLSLNGVETIVRKTITTMRGAVSIDKVTEDFVVGLQAVQARTVPTVFRTGEKMDITLDDSAVDIVRCVFCQAPLDTDVSESSALSATIFSQSVSSLKSPLAACGATTECCGQGDDSCHNSSSSVNAEDLNAALCYGCRLVVKDMTDLSTLPEAVLNATGRSARRGQMKETIKDFLLPEDPK